MKTPLLCSLACLLVSSTFAAPERRPSTFCNPLPIPNYPIGRAARNMLTGDPVGTEQLWYSETREQFRELADPTALWLDGKWYLYPSADMAWVSSDLGATWQHHPLNNTRDIGYAPTVVQFRGKFYLTASWAELYVSDNPLGPFTSLGSLKIDPASGAAAFMDPMLFADGDRLYVYWGCTKNGGIWGAELSGASPTTLLTRPKELIRFSPASQPWERMGASNQTPDAGWMEGAWMLKRNGRYYLTYSAAGTQYRTYAMGCYTSSSPLGDFTPQKRNPILRTVDGLVTGTAHGCIVPGPENQLWAFYCVRSSVVHGFERRIGMDRAFIDANEELYVLEATSSPQWLPGRTPSDKSASFEAFIPQNISQPAVASSSAPNLRARLAVDNDLLTWWEPAASDVRPTLTCMLEAPARISAVRLVWRDVGLDIGRGVVPGPFRYLVEAETEPGVWQVILDRSKSQEDLLVDYRETVPTVTSKVRLTVVAWPKGIRPGVAEFTSFAPSQTK
jgi:hypothetical protein